MNENNPHNKFVAFIDILGFSELVEKNSHDDLVNLYKNIIIVSTEDSCALGHKKIIKKPDGSSMAIADLSKAKLNSTAISDSIIFWTEKADMQSYIDIITVARKMLVSGLFCGFPLRGAISFGPLSFLNNTTNISKNKIWNISTLFGRSIIDAYNLEKEQNWLGAVIDNRIWEYFRQQYKAIPEEFEKVKKVFVDQQLLIEYDIPFKFSSKKMFAINWPKGNGNNYPKKREIDFAFKAFNKTIEDEKVKEKLHNTNAFLNYCLKDIESKNN